MFILGNFLQAIAVIANMALGLLMWVIIISALISWVNPDPYNPIVVFLRRVSDPILSPIRRLIPMHGIGIDVSPILAIFAIYFVRIFLIQSLLQLAEMIK